ncbi:MAG TPA: iron-containing alcohol dehydrogenase [Anaerolineae bacterium]|mgnify:CR=1 FL=1|nr:iron-containing alcohol dehydrogenase [Anaerolineae bacterium]HOQ99052.1 iron-containing alcohol dehydrogenase [Anaerolineae bacterium]HPL27816.1 iron-containing alcohol dehydrogenase [Anaerolineae bacterium]
MWYFVSPQIVFGEGALDALDELVGRRALVVTDATLVRLGLVEEVAAHLARAGLELRVFDEVEPDPSVATVRRGAALALEYEPDWIVGLGGGSCLDAAKAIWVLYERPDLEPGAINPMEPLGLRQKARLITIPTTSGTGAEATWAIVLTDTVEQRKMGLGSRENAADLAIVDPALASRLPPRITADTGLDALTHAVEAYTCNWHTDITDGLALQAVRLVFAYLPRAVADGSDAEARERLHNAATCAGLAFGNAMASLAHAMGHALGAVFHLPHGRAVALCLPYTVEFAAREAPERFAELEALVAVAPTEGESGARALAARIRALARRVGNPLSLAEAGLDRAAYEAQLDKLVDDAFNDTQMVTAVRAPSYDELRRLYVYAHEGREVDF